MAAQGFPLRRQSGRKPSSYISAAVPNATIPLASVNMSYQCDPRSYLNRPVHQTWLFYDEQLDAQMMPEVLARFPCFDLVRWHKTGVDIMPATVNKWTGCQWVMQATGFAPEQAVAFGDGLNDIQMLQGSAWGSPWATPTPNSRPLPTTLHPPCISTVLPGRSLPGSGSAEKGEGRKGCASPVFRLAPGKNAVCFRSVGCFLESMAQPIPC